MFLKDEHRGVEWMLAIGGSGRKAIGGRGRVPADLYSTQWISSGLYEAAITPRKKRSCFPLWSSAASCVRAGRLA